MVCESDTGEERFGEPSGPEHGERGLVVVFADLELRWVHTHEKCAQRSETNPNENSLTT